MRVLTLWPEWAWAIFNLGKDVENRSWPPFIDPGSDLLIHAGRNVGGKQGGPSSIRGMAAMAEVARAAGWHVDRSHDSVIWTFKKGGLVHHVTWLRSAARDSEVSLVPTSRIVGAVRFDGVVESSSAWASADLNVHHWQVSDPRPFGKVYEARGKQGLWRLPEVRERSMKMELDWMQEVANSGHRLEVWVHDVVDRHSAPPTVWSGRRVGAERELADAHRLACSVLQEAGGRPVNVARILRDGQHVRTLVQGDGLVQEVPDELQVLERSA